MDISYTATLTSATLEDVREETCTKSIDDFIDFCMFSQNLFLQSIPCTITLATFPSA